MKDYAKKYKKNKLVMPSVQNSARSSDIRRSWGRMILIHVVND